MHLCVQGWIRVEVHTTERIQNNEHFHHCICEHIKKKPTGSREVSNVNFMSLPISCLTGLWAMLSQDVLSSNGLA